MRRTAVADLRIGALCAGMGGLELAAQAVVGGTVAWHAENDPHASRVLAHHWPDVPNLGDLTAVDWVSVEPVDVVTAGYPCQPFSHAGQRKGSADVRHLWPHIAVAVRVLRPRFVLLENVAGHVSLGLDAVLGELAALGFDAAWGCLRASDIGAPHGRARVFIAATDAAGEACAASAHPGRIRGQQGRVAAPGETRGGRAHGVVAGRGGTRTAADAQGDPWRFSVGDGAAPAHAARHGRDERRTEPTRLVGGPDAPLGCTDGCALGWDWGDYATAVHSWHDSTRCVPPPVQTTGRGGGAQLSALFTEWMMALPLGHVTDPAIWAGMRPSTARNAQLTILGNGVVPAQAEAAYRMLLPTLLAEGRAA